MNPNFVQALQAGVIPSGIIVATESVLGPYLASPTVNWSVLISTIEANAANGLSATFAAIQAAAPQIITAPAWESEALAIACGAAAAILAHQATVAG